MITYCPNCANMLLVEKEEEDRELRYYCQACPYVYRISAKITRLLPLVKKAVDDVMGADSAASAWPQTDQIRCPKCGHNRAHYNEMQTRSADEPATIFYKCTECDAQWKEG